MKLSKLFFAILHISMYTIHEQQASTCDPNKFLISGPIRQIHKNLIDSFGPSYPVVASVQQSDGTLRAQQYIKDRTLAHTVPPKTKDVLQHGSFTTLHGQPTDYHNYPPGNTLFPGYPSLAQKFDSLINLMQTKPKFKAFFNKIHLNVLNELYKHLMNIYTNFNIQHVGIREVETPQGASALKISIPTFLHYENEYEANKKTLIINHFVNIIESQFNGKIKSIMPTIPHLFATSAGKTLIQNDYSIDLTHLILQQIEPAIAESKKQYLENMAIYLDFFHEFTSYLEKPHPKKEQHFTAFVHIAETINDFLYGTENVGEDTTADAQIQSVLKKMSPPMFTFNYDDVRALKLIPHIAKSLPPNTMAIQWPPHIIEAANKGVFINCHPLAYFTNDTGQVVTQDQAKHLYIVMQSGKNYFQEELLRQPEWLNSWDGIIKILRACFGDFTAILGMGILDPCMEALIQNGVSTMLGKDPNEENSLTAICHNLLESYKHQAIAKAPAPKGKMPLSEISNLLPTQTTKLQPSSFAPSTSDISSSPNDMSSSPNDTSNLSPSTNDISSSSSYMSGLSPSTNDVTNMNPSNEDVSPALTQ